MENLPSSAQIEKELSEKSFYYFIKFAWHLVDATPFDESAWHIKLLADYFQAIYQGKIRNLQINIPPRLGKSRIASMFPAWVWLHNNGGQAKKFIYSSYSQELANDSVKICRNIISSDWYLTKWTVFIAKGGDRQDFIQNYRGGFLYATGTGGTITGKGADFLIADDILKAGEEMSEPAREGANSWFSDVFSNRFNNVNTFSRIVIGQRLHNHDLFGYLEEKEKESLWDKVVLPMEYEGTRFTSRLGLNDPRKEVGESIWQSRFTKEAIENLKASYSELGAACQLQQRPSLIAGNIFKESWFSRREQSTDYVARYISVDTALSENQKTACYSCAIVVEVRSDYTIFIRDIWKGKVGFPELEDAIVTLAGMYKHQLNGIIIENKASGISLLQTLAQSTETWISELLIPFNPKRQGKEERASLASLWCEKGCVILPPPTNENPWLFDFEKELFGFPQAAYKDSVDAFDQAIIYLEPYISEGYRLREGVS